MPAPLPKTPKKPVQDRSTATRAALLDAALESLCDKGYAAATTTDVALRAGVSRGAQLHHFPTKASLLAAAVEHLLERRIVQFRDAIAQVTSRPDRLDAALDTLWAMFQGPVFVAWVELWIAARTDASLAAAMIEIDRRFTEETRRLSADVFSTGETLDPQRAEMMRDFAFAVMTGVALQRLVPRGQRPASDYVNVLKRIAHVMLSAESQ